MKCIIEDSLYLLINFYNANRQNEQLKALQNLNDIISGIELESDTRFIFGGDFNIIYDVKLNADGGSPSLKLSSISTLESIKEYLNICDIFRVRFPDKRRFTYRSRDPSLQRRLDYLFISNELMDNVLSIDILPSINTDYSRSAVYLSLSISITYSKRKTRDRKAERLGLESKVNHLESTFTIDTCEELKKEFEESKAKLEQLYDYFTQGAIIKSKCSWYEKDEKSTKYFLNSEKPKKA